MKLFTKTKHKNLGRIYHALFKNEHQSFKMMILCICFLFVIQTGFGQSNVTVSGAHTSSNGSYTTLEAAFAAINAQSQGSNNIEISVDVSTSESATAVLNSGTWTSLKIFPSSAGVAIVGSLAAPLISLEGASNVTIDGRVGGLSSGASFGLIIRNTITSTTAGTSTICLVNGASNNIVKHARLEGSSMSTTSGTVYFATSTGSAGNNNNVFVQNILTNASGSRPKNSIYSEGTTTKANIGNVIRDNNFADFFSATTSSQGVLLQANNEDWVIRGNSFYETGTLSPNGTHVYTVIYVNNTGINGSIIRGNFIGGTSANAGGTNFTKSNSSNNVFYGIRVNAGNTTLSQIDSNIIQRINWTNNSGSNWFGIAVDEGFVDIGITDGNKIGDLGAAVTLSNTVTSVVSNLYGIHLAGNNSIRVRHNMLTNLNLTTAVNGSNLYGVFINATGSVDVDSNEFTSLTTASVSGFVYAASLYAIFKSATAGNLNIRGNTIGSSSVSNSLHASSVNNTTQHVYGIRNSGTATITISGNTIANLTNAAVFIANVGGIESENGLNYIQSNTIRNLTGSSTGAGGSITGIRVSGTPIKNIEGNTIFNLFNISTNNNSFIYGISFTGGTVASNNGIFNNFIHSLDVPNNTSTNAATIYGIFDAGSPLVTNNIVSVYTTKTAIIYGVWINGVGGLPFRKYYHNTFYVGGTATAGAAPSFAIYSNHIFNKQYLNNIFANERSGGSGKHCVIRLARIDGSIIDYNTYFAGSAAVLGIFGTVDYTTLPAWRELTMQDIASRINDPQFALSGGIASTDYIPAATNLIGAPDLNVTQDFSGTTRQYFSAGAFEVPTPGTVVVSSTTGLNVANYADLVQAFAKINDGTHTGVVEVEIISSHPLTQTAVLNASGSGAASYSSVHVFPTDTGIIVQATFLNHLIDLNGASNVQIDGRVWGGSGGAPFALTLINNTNDNTGRSIIRLINGASDNTVKFTFLKAGFLHEGIIFVSTSTATTGNNNNVFVRNKLTNAYGIRPLAGLMALGTVGKNNTGNVFRDNEVYDILRTTNACQGVHLGAYNDNWTIRGNSFFETNILSATGATNNFHAYTIVFVSPIQVNNTVILGNFIGGTEVYAAGTSFTKPNTHSNVFYGIRVQATNTTTQIDSNIIQNIHWTNNQESYFYGIAVQVADNRHFVNANIGLIHGNEIGGTGAPITFINENPAHGDRNFFGIYLNGKGDFKVKNNHLNNLAISAQNLFGIYAIGDGNIDIDTNTIENLSTYRVNTTAFSHLYGIYKFVATAAGKTFNVRGNIIGSTSVVNSLHATSPSTSAAQLLYGMYLYGEGTKNVSNNIVANLTNESTNATTTTNGRINGIYVFSKASINNNLIHNLSIANANTLTGNNASVAGIVVQGGDTLRGNTIFNLRNLRTDFEGNIHGMYTYYFPGQIEKNLIHSLEVPNNNNTSFAKVYGIFNLNVNTTKVFFNNIVVLDGSQTVKLHGIYEDGGGVTNIYHNTVYIGGTAASGAAESYALWNNGISARNYRNNIFVNERTGGSGSHYAIRLAGTTNLGIDFNTYFVSNTGVLGNIAATDYTSLASWQTATSQDANSKVSDPQFATAGGLLAANYIPAAQDLLGNPYLNVASDFAGVARQYYSMGAHEVFVAQGIVNVNATLGVPSAGYFDLIQAFTRINNGIHRGNIEVVINKSHNLTATASLNASGVGASDYVKLRLFPSVSALVVSGSILNAPLIDLNGACNVTFDGRVGGASSGASHSLTIRNTTQHQGVGTSTLRFWNGASADSILFMRIEGSSLATLSGTVFFATSTAPTGSNNNVLSNNHITNAVGLRPFNSIFSLGTTAKPNTDNKILHNEFFDFLSHQTGSHGVHLNENNENWAIAGNSFYETNTYVPILSGAHTVIFINHTGINGTLIRGNFIGGSQPYALGLPLEKTNAQNNIFCGIRINAGSTLVTQVDSNYIGNMDWANSSGSHWYGIDVVAGRVDIGLNFGNHIGGASATINCANTTLLYGIHLAGTSTIRVRNNSISNIHLLTAVSGSNLYGISASASGNVDIDTNSMFNLTTNTTTGLLAANLFGIYKNGTSAILNIRGNTIGSTTTANSMHASSASSSANLWQAVYGIQNISTGTINILHNTIANLTNSTTNTGSNDAQVNVVNGIYSTNGINLIEGNTILNLSNANANTTSSQFASVGGIVLITTTTKTVRNNTVSGLRNIRTNFSGSIYGIYFTGATGTNNGVYGNFVHSLEVPNNTSTTAAQIYGIRHISSGITTLANNIVMIKGDQTATLFGLYDNASTGTSNYYHNTVYLAGTASAGTAPSYAFWGNSAAAVQDYRNNIFANQRSGGTGIHYAIRLAGTSTLTINNNLYYVGGSGQVGNLSSNRTTLANWRTATSQDQNSLDIDPVFTQAGSLNAADYLPTAVALRGVNDLMDIDYALNNRIYDAVGAFDFPVFIQWIGGVGSNPTDWNDRLNWQPNNAVPGATDIVGLLDNSNGHHLVLDQHRTVRSLCLNAANKYVKLGDFNLTITDTITLYNSTSYTQTNGTGKLVKSIGTSKSYFFPVGNASYNPVKIHNRTDAADGFSVRVLNDVKNSGLTGKLNMDERVDITWDITKNSGSAANQNGVDMEFFWQIANEVSTRTGSGFNVAALNYFNSSQNAWEIATTGNTSYAAGQQSLLHTGYKGTFSPFAIGGSELTPLPITLSRFEASILSTNPNQCLIFWQTASEFNASHFEIEWSTDGEIWVQIGAIPAAGNSQEFVQYDFEHHFPATVNFYRLRSIDLNGAYSLSSIRTITFDNEIVTPSVILFPNPAHATFTLKLLGVEKADFEIFDMQGKLIKQGQILNMIELGGFRSGVYQIHISLGNKVVVQKVVVSN